MPRDELFVGIDPGVSGGLAAIDTGSVVHGYAPVANLTPYAVWEWIKCARHAPCVLAALEKVGGYVGEGHARGSHMFKFGHSAGMLEGFLVACDCPFELVTPQKWQKSLGIHAKKKSESRDDFKRRLKTFAQSLFPNEKITSAVADALLLAEYARRVKS